MDALSIVLVAMALVVGFVCIDINAGGSVTQAVLRRLARRVDSTNAADLPGRIATVVTGIASGRGRVRVADTTWTAEGPDMTEGSRCRIVALRDTVLVVEPIP